MFPVAASSVRGSGWCQQKRVRGRAVIRILGGERGRDQQRGHRCHIYTISINFTLSTECPEKGWCLFNKAWTLSCSYLMETLLRKINLRLASICQFLMDFRAIDGHLNKHHPFYWDTLYKLLSYILSMFAGPGLGRSSHAETQTQIRGISLETALRRKSRAGSSDSNVSNHVIEIIFILTVVQ